MMKRIFILLVLAIIAAATFAQNGLSLEESIERIARDIEVGLPVGRRIAVVNFESPSAKFSVYVLEELQGILVNNHRLVVVDRSRLELLRNELEFQMSGEVSDESAVSIGRFLGAQVIVTGNLIDLGGSYRCRFNAIDIETAVRQVSAAVTMRRDNTIAYLLPSEAAPPAQIPTRPDPALATLYFNSGFTHYEAKQYTEAVADFTRALEVKRDDEASLRYRSYSYFNLKEYDRTITDMSRLIDIRPGNAESYLTRSGAYIANGDYDRGIADCDQALKLNPNMAEAYTNRSSAHYGKGEWNRAIVDSTEAIRLNPNDADAYYNRGGAYTGKGDYTRAIIDFTEAIRLKPNGANAYHSRGFAYANRGDWGRAIADYNDTARLDSNNAVVYLNRGVAYANMGEIFQARSDWERALELDPNDDRSRQNLEELLQRNPIMRMVK
jgi:tetratricopeptide (TPR) repeat protein